MCKEALGMQARRADQRDNQCAAEGLALRGGGWQAFSGSERKGWKLMRGTAYVNGSHCGERTTNICPKKKELKAV